MNTTKTVKKQTHMGAERVANGRDELTVVEVLEWHHDNYCRFKYKTGLVFLDEHCRDSYDLYCALLNSGTWWGWWKSQWAARDAAFVAPEYLNELRAVHLGYRRSAYRALHDGRSLVAKLTVPVVVGAAAMSEYMEKKGKGFDVRNVKVARVCFGGYRSEEV